MGPRAVVLTFVAAVAAVVAGFISGGLVRETVGGDHEVVIGVVDAQAGAPIVTSTASPAPTLPPIESAAPSELGSPSPSPTAEASLGPCPGTPPREGCTCRERKKNSRWVCPVF